MLRALEEQARALGADSPRFTRRNLFHAVRRALGTEVSEAAFEAALRKRLARGELPGLLPVRSTWKPRRLGREWDAYFPKAVVLVDRPAIVDLFVASGILASWRLAVVCADGSPSTVVDWLDRGFRAGRTAPVVYLHDAATVLYPFSLAPLAAMVEQRGDRPLAYRDLGLPPLGAGARRFDDPALPADQPILELEALPPSTLVRYAAQSAFRLIPGDPNMLPLTQESERRRQQEALRS